MTIKSVSYYQRLKCHAFYRDGIQQRIENGEELIMLSFFENGISCITDYKFIVNDVLILNIHIDRYPYEKLMCQVMSAFKKGDLNELKMEVMGIPNTLNERIRMSLDLLPEPELALTTKEKQVLADVLKRLLNKE